MSRGDGLARLRQALEDHGSQVRGTSAQCPAHEDRQASLSIGQGRDGALVNCHAGCVTDEVLEALGLSAADLFDEPRGTGRDDVVIAVYAYTDEAGAPLFFVERRAGKRFRQYHLTGGGKVWNLRGVRRVPYRLPQLLGAARSGQAIYVAEGEKDVHALEAAGATATCNPMGAGKWRDEYARYFGGAGKVIVIADRDEPGRAHAWQVAASLREVVAEVEVVEAAVGKDAADHLATGFGLDQFRPARQPPGASAGEAGTRRLVLTPASRIPPEPVTWAWEDDGYGRIPAGSLGLFAGREGTGKSCCLAWQSAKITRGELPGAFSGAARAVIYIAVEDSWKFTIVPRLIAAGADLDLVYRAEVRTEEDETVTLNLPADNVLLAEAITERNVALVVLDPLLSAISDTLDTHVNRQVRQALEPLSGAAERTGAVIAGIAHFSKQRGTDASSLITASGAFKDVARFVFAFAVDDDGTHVITQTKNNLGFSGLPSLAYRIIEAVVPTASGDAKVGRFVLDGPADRTVQDILNAQQDGERDEKARAGDYLTKALSSGPRRSKEVEEEAHEGHGISKRTLDRARSRLRIPAKKHGPDWWISLPEHEGDLNDPEGKGTTP